MRLSPARLTLLGGAILSLLVGIGGANGVNPFARRNPITELYHKNLPSVVKITAPDRRGGEPNIGTGVIVDERGWIITNWHVVQDCDTPCVTLHDGTQVTGKVKFARRQWDLAAVEIKTSKKLRAQRLVRTDDLMVGELVAAIGHPYGYDNSLATGYISGLKRQIRPAKDELRDIIQITASINPGNSGGPLFNINGELIGIIVAIRNEAQGIAFAINANTIKEVLSRLLSAEAFAQVNHGLVFDEKLAGETGERQSVVVKAFQGICEGEAVLQPGDHVRTVAGQAVINRFDVERALWDHKPGDTVELRVEREGKSLVIALRLGTSTGAGSAVSASPADAPRSATAPMAKVLGVSHGMTSP
ncbi:MAG: trypsin-like peptidase domain-containing protein [Gemmataceae bacterium]|nr:trypsin-like peptidase domain-containing protein [Gemmataceae bacterium]